MRPSSHRLVSQALAAVQQSGADLFVAPDARFEGSDLLSDIAGRRSSSTSDHRLEQHARARPMRSLHPCMRMAPGRPAASKDTAAASSQGADALLGRVAGQASALLFSSMRPCSRRLDDEEHLDSGIPAASNLAGALAPWSSAQPPKQQQQQRQLLLQQQLHLQRLHAEAHQQLLRARMRRKQQRLMIDSDSSAASTPVSCSCAGSTNSTPGLEQGSKRCGSPSGGIAEHGQGCAKHDQQPGNACDQRSSASTQLDSEAAADACSADAGPADSNSSCSTAVLQRSQTVSSNLVQADAAQQGLPLPSSAVAITARRSAGAPSQAAAAAAVARSAAAAYALPPAAVCVYACEDGTSRASLDLANSLMATLVLPDGVRFLPVQPDSLLFKLAAGWQLPAFAVCLGSSYFQRMLHRVPQLAHAAMCCPGMEELAADLDKPVVRLAQLSGPDAVAALSSLRCVQFSCVFLALKAVDKVHALGLLRFMLSKLSTDGAAVSPAQAAGIEAKCLAALDWRLGPFFAEDELL